ncbi:MAG: hypothetical protein GF363_00450 [Chitinivibrionales bacterium]|nr:hypothetical protein [Chitinivibrionales bacterium]
MHKPHRYKSPSIFMREAGRGLEGHGGRRAHRFTMGCRPKHARTDGAKEPRRDGMSERVPGPARALQLDAEGLSWRV